MQLSSSQLNLSCIWGEKLVYILKITVNVHVVWDLLLDYLHNKILRSRVFNQIWYIASACRVRRQEIVNFHDLPS